MRRVALVLAGLAVVMAAGSAARQRGLVAPHAAAGARVRPGVAVAASSGSDARVVAAVDAVARRYGVAGEVLVARGGRVLLARGYGTIRPDGGPAHRAGERWRLASITKQVAAALAVRAIVTEGSLADLDKPLVQAAGDGRADGMASFGKLTVRQLLTHHTGLANPDATPPNAAGVPGFYTQAPNLTYCLSQPASPGAPFSYNNCDYLVIGRGLDPNGWPAGLSMAGANEAGVPGYVAGKPEPAFQLANWGASGGLLGTASAVFDFDRALMTGKLLPPAALTELWKPEGGGSYQALGQWVFPGQLAGCAAAKRVVQRDGEIYGVQARNFILPEDDLVVIFFANRSADDFRIGEVWQRSGFAFDLLSAAVSC